MPKIKLSPAAITNLESRGIPPASIQMILNADMPEDGAFLDLSLGTPMARAFNPESTLFNPFQEKQLVAVNGQLFLLDSGLGQGNYGAVYKGVDLESGEEVAIKFSDVPKEDIGDIYTQPLVNEREVLKRKGDLKGSGVGTGKKSADNTCHLTIMPLVKGPNLEDFLYTKHKDAQGNVTHVTKNDIPLADRVMIATQMLDELARLHQLGVLHRDFKPDNMHWDPEAKKLTVIDFGESHQTADPGVPISDEYSFKGDYHAGSYLYLSPEALSDMAYSAKSDGYSAGLILADLFSDYNLLQDKNDKAAEYPFESDRNPVVIKALMDAMASMTQGHDENAVMAKMIYKNAILPLVNPDPSQRATIATSAEAIRAFSVSVMQSMSPADLGVSSNVEKQRVISNLNFAAAERSCAQILNDPENSAFLEKFNKSHLIGTSYHVTDKINALQDCLEQKKSSKSSAQESWAQTIELVQAIQDLKKEIGKVPGDSLCRRQITIMIGALEKDATIRFAAGYMDLNMALKNKDVAKILGNNPQIQKNYKDLMSLIEMSHKSGMVTNHGTQVRIAGYIEDINSIMEKENIKSESLSSVLSSVQTTLSLPEARAAVVTEPIRPEASSSAAASIPTLGTPSSSSSRSRAVSAVPAVDFSSLLSANQTAFSPRIGAPKTREVEIQTSPRAPMHKRGPAEASSSGSGSSPSTLPPPSSAMTTQRKRSSSVLSRAISRKFTGAKIQQGGSSASEPKQTDGPSAVNSDMTDTLPPMRSRAVTFSQGAASPNQSATTEQADRQTVRFDTGADASSQKAHPKEASDTAEQEKKKSHTISRPK